MRIEDVENVDAAHPRFPRSQGLSTPFFDADDTPLAEAIALTRRKPETRCAQTRVDGHVKAPAELAEFLPRLQLEVSATRDDVDEVVLEPAFHVKPDRPRVAD